MMRTAKRRKAVTVKTAVPMPLRTKLILAGTALLLVVLDVMLAYYWLFLREPAAGAAAGVSSAAANQMALNAADLLKPVPEPKFELDYSNAVQGTIPGIPLTGRGSAGILVDLDRRRVLWARNPHKSVPIASMTKMMTCLLLFERLDKEAKSNPPKITFQTKLLVTRNASRVGESSVYLRENEEFTIEEYLKAVIVKSANDAAFELGEFLGGGNIDNFIKMMNARADELGMKDAVYTSPNGLPNAKKENCMASPNDLVLLAHELLKYPYLEYSRLKGGKIRQYTYRTTNRLLSKVEGVDGIKTGYTNAARSCITVSCLRNGRRLVLVLTGMPSGADRDNCATQLLDWGYKRR